MSHIEKLVYHIRGAQARKVRQKFRAGGGFRPEKSRCRKFSLVTGRRSRYNNVNGGPIGSLAAIRLIREDFL
jgi:hypothetical protein